MNDSYSELLVKKEQTGKDKVIKFLLIGVIAATAVVGKLKSHKISCRIS